MDKEKHKINGDALARTAKAKTAAKRGKAVIDSKSCKGCGLCVSICPAGVLRFHDSPGNKWGVDVAAAAPEYCNGCGKCEMQCPDFAVFAYKSGEYETEAV